MIRIGQGWDIHRLTENKPLILGGIIIPSERGCEAHSDGDVLIHAIIDSLFGAAADGDIGSHFPPSDQKFKDIDSTILLIDCFERISSLGYSIINLDTTIILETPRLRTHIDSIRNNLAHLLNIPVNRISVKAKTKEKMDAVGMGEAIEAMAIVLLENI